MVYCSNRFVLLHYYWIVEVFPMQTFLNVLLVILAVVLVALVLLYFLGRKLEKRQVEQQQLLEM